MMALYAGQFIALELHFYLSQEPNGFEWTTGRKSACQRAGI